MMKLVVLAAVVAIAVAQMNPQTMMMMNLMRQQSSPSGKAGAAGAAGKSGMGMGSMSGMSRMFNNPMLLCRQTENFRPVPCGSMPAFCDMISYSTYKFPGLLTCSPMGIGCCIKDIQSLMLINQMA